MEKSTTKIEVTFTVSDPLLLKAIASPENYGVGTVSELLNNAGRFYCEWLSGKGNSVPSEENPNKQVIVRIGNNLYQVSYDPTKQIPLPIDDIRKELEKGKHRFYVAHHKNSGETIIVPLLYKQGRVLSYQCFNPSEGGGHAYAYSIGGRLFFSTTNTYCEDITPLHSRRIYMKSRGLFGGYEFIGEVLRFKE